MKTQEYNGWTNYETWNVKLWIENSESDQSFWQEQASLVLADAELDKTFTKDERAKLNLMALLKDHYEEAKADLLDHAKLSCSVWADLLGAAFSEVNWYEIASSLIDDAIEHQTTTQSLTNTPQS